MTREISYIVPQNPLQTQTNTHCKMNRHVQLLSSVPIVERLLRSQSRTVPTKQCHRMLQVLACTCRALRDGIGKGTPTWQWAQRTCISRHFIEKWRRHADRGWLHDVPYWTHQFRHATDMWFEHHGPTFVASDGMCRVEDGCWLKHSGTSRLLWIESFLGSGRQVSTGQTETLQTRLQMCRLSDDTFSVAPWRYGDFTVGTHVYCGNRIIDDQVEDAAYCFTDGTYTKIGRGRWVDVQRCYVPTLLTPFNFRLSFRLRDASMDDLDVWCTHTLFLLDHERREWLLRHRSIQYPFDKNSTFTLHDFTLCVEQTRCRQAVLH